MNDKFTDTNHDEEIARKLAQVAEQTHANAQFASDLEQTLRQAHQPKQGWWMAFNQISPALRWVGLMILLAVVLSWSIKTLIPAPQPAIDSTPVHEDLPTPTPAPDVLPDTSATPETQEGGFDFRGAKLFIESSLPGSATTAHVYVLDKDQPASLEEARAFAERFGIQGEIYTGPNYVFNTTDYVFSDGKQMLSVYSERYFSYTSDMAKIRRKPNGWQHENAEEIIHTFLLARGMDFPFSISASDFFGGYVIRPLAPDTLPIQYESFTYPAMRMTLNENGEILNIDASLMDFDQASLGEYNIITAQEALDVLLDDAAMVGKMEFSHSAGSWPLEWYRTFPDDQTVTMFGYLTLNPAVDQSKPYLITVNGNTLTGNTSGMENLGTSSFIKVVGQFHVQNGIRKFNVESWDRKITEVWASGVIRREGDQVILANVDGSGEQYPLIDPPADLPIDAQTPENTIGVAGVIEDNKLSWYYLQFFEGNSGGGGGGGGGFGFYKLNLTGTPVPFPTPIPQSEMASSDQFTGTYTIQEGDTLGALAERFGTTVDELMRLNGMTDTNIFIGQNFVIPVPEPTERRVEDLRGYLSITIHNKVDGTSSKEYALQVTQEGGTNLYAMGGSILNELDAYNALPLLITGTINTSGTLVVESYEIPYPDLQFQILKGTQRSEQIDGQTVVIFTTEDGTSYVEFMATNPFPTDSYTGYQGDLIQQEVLIIPDETFGGMPVAHVYQSSIFQESAPAMQVVANQIYVYNESELPSDGSTPPDLTIEQVELVYYVSNPYYQANDPNYDQRSPYIQPVWHFRGRYANGTEFDILIQALKQEFLLPELAPGIGPG